MKTDLVPPGKSPPKHIPRWRVDSEELAALSHRKWSRCRLENRHRNTCQRWRVDSEELTSLVDSEKDNKNGVGVAWEIITETPSKGDAWIRKCSQPLLSQKKSTKQLLNVTRGFVSAHSPSWLINSQRKLSRCRLRNKKRSPCRLVNHLQKYFQRWRVDPEKLAAPSQWK
jgi:hypothetical protein